jgi:ADP-ribosylglycohydrolase
MPLSVDRTRVRVMAVQAALAGLSVGDALGERFFGDPEIVRARIAARELPPEPWRWTDDTLMACSVAEAVVDQDQLDQSRLLSSLARRAEPSRGYGGGVFQLLADVRAGHAGLHSASKMFEGRGSWGNGAAARVAPLGAAFHERPDRELVDAADRSAEVTHAHPEGRAGAIAVAAAAALAARSRGEAAPAASEFLLAIVGLTPPSAVADGLREAAALPVGTTPEEAARKLGSGLETSAADTVPFALWASAVELDDLEQAFWLTVAGLGDRDTTCAISCGVVACRVGIEGVPAEWLAAREPLPGWFAANVTLPRPWL